MAEPTPDLETPLLSDVQQSSYEHQATHQRQKSIETAGSYASKHKWKVRPSNEEGVHSGRWKFNYHKFLTADVFAEADDHTEGRREYNRKQRETLAGFDEVDSILAVEFDDKANFRRPEEGSEKIAILLSNIFNVILLIVKVFASWKSGSLAIVASTLDSLLDLLAGLVLWFAHCYMQSKNHYKYPIGKLRIQPVGIVIFAATMATIGMQVLITGVEQLLEGDKQPMTVAQRNWLIIIMGSATVVKLGLFLYCRSFQNEIVNVYAQDHFFDVITNVLGLAAALLADFFFSWIDPLGAIFLALYTIINWGKTVLENAFSNLAASLVGKAASPNLLQKLTYMAFNHHHQIQRIDTVRAYTFGTFYFVEVDIELPEDMPLKEAHEIGESLQNRLEVLPEVERAFVHLDYESAHRPEHFAAEFKH